MNYEYPLRIVVCGDRNWTDIEKIYDRLVRLPLTSVIIEGEAPGADSLAREVWESLGGTVIPVPAEWDRYRPKDPKRKNPAGVIRNQVMLDLQPDLVIAFHSDLTQSRGTRDTVSEARRRRIPTEIIT